jgi:hypothetical protein
VITSSSLTGAGSSSFEHPINNELTNKVQIFWAQESDSKGKQLIFTDQELEDLEKDNNDLTGLLKTQEEA